MKHALTSFCGTGCSINVRWEDLSQIWEAGLGLRKEKLPGAPGLGPGCPREASEGKLVGFSCSPHSIPVLVLERPVDVKSRSLASETRWGVKQPAYPLLR